jgi:hypothetical protein
VGLLRTFIETLATTGAVAPSESDDPEPLPQPLAAAEAAMQEAIRKHQARAPSADTERRVTDLPDRRKVRTAVSVERRGAAPDRRSKGQAFGRRTRD